MCAAFVVSASKALASVVQRSEVSNAEVVKVEVADPFLKPDAGRLFLKWCAMGSKNMCG
jgi:hypothetical protein